MPRTVAKGFEDLLTKLTPTSTESKAAKDHRKSIKARLESDFEILRFFRTGSFGNGTSVSGYSDVDYFAWIPVENRPSNSDTALRRVRDGLDARFPNTGVRVDCPAVHVPFWDGSTEVVPVGYEGETASGHDNFRIPNCSGGWVPSSPEAHKAYVKRVDEKLGGKVRPLVRFIKAWKFYNSVPISSFYLELRVAKYATGETTILYNHDVKRILAFLNREGIPAIRDPVGVSGLVEPCRTTSQLETARSKVATAAKRAERAVNADSSEKTREAFEWWNKLYNGKFPSYY